MEESTILLFSKIYSYIEPNLTTPAYELMNELFQEIKKKDDTIFLLRRENEMLKSMADNRGHDDNDNLD